MEPDKFQQAWRTQAARMRVTVDPDLLLQEAQRHQRDFRRMIACQDYGFIVNSLLAIPVWIFIGLAVQLPWTWYLMVPVNLWYTIFTLVTRSRRPRPANDPGEPLLSCVKDLLALVDQQVRWQRNLWWSSILPTFVVSLIFVAQVMWQELGGLTALLVTAGVGVMLSGLFVITCRHSQHIASHKFEPQRRELLALLRSLGDETIVDAGQSQDAPRFSPFIETARVTSSLTSGRLAASWVAVFLLLLAALLLQMALIRGTGSPRLEAARSTGPGGDALAALITRLRSENQLVGLGAMVMVDGKIQAAAVIGERKVGSGVPLEISDRWHLGGITKSVTATMMARLVEAGKLSWSTTVGECFPDAPIHADWQPVTLRQLLTDTAGAPAGFSYQVRLRQPPPGPARIQARREAVLEVMKEQPVSPPREKFAYSNVGYTIAAAMVEQMTGSSWEELVKREVFEPLVLTSAGFGPPTSSDETLEQPRGHRKVHAEKLAVDDMTDNTPIMGPSGSVHMTLQDLCTYATDQLRGDRANGTLLTAETYRLLHTPERSYYAFGWIRTEPSRQVPSTMYWHNGSNTLWYAFVALIPERNMVIAVTANDGDSVRAEAAALEIVKETLKQSNVADKPSVPERATYPKAAPYTGIRWEGNEPVIRINEEWGTLVSLDGIPADEIVAFSQRTYQNLWRKRFEEDLVEVLIRLGHTPGNTVQLVVRPAGSSTARILNDVPMMEANRRRIYQSPRDEQRGQ